VPYSAKAMFALVNDIEAYPEFLPLCSAATILQRNADTMTARVELSKGPLHQSFTTRNRLAPHSAIHMSLVDGPFKFLQGSWSFKPLDGDLTEVALDLGFEFKNRLLATAFGKLFKQLSATMVEAFCRRARELYG
jgi:ribosome-associated toxin RatA of RatAB toxin-antitoxin module